MENARVGFTSDPKKTRAKAVDTAGTKSEQWVPAVRDAAGLGFTAETEKYNNHVV